VCWGGLGWGVLSEPGRVTGGMQYRAAEQNLATALAMRVATIAPDF